jgi:hypothetical protein
MPAFKAKVMFQGVCRFVEIRYASRNPDEFGIIGVYLGDRCILEDLDEDQWLKVEERTAIHNEENYGDDFSMDDMLQSFSTTDAEF